MSKKVFNVFSILCFALVLCFIGCTELINPKTETDINLNIDLSKIMKSTRNTGETQSSASIGENPTIKVAIYDAKKYDSTKNSTDNLDLITEAQAQIVDNEAKVKLNNIPVGIYAIVFAELSFSNGNSTEVMYAGNSKVFRVEASNNKISLVLTKVGNSETSPDDTNTPYENYTLYKKTENGEEKISNDNEATISTSSTMETKVTVRNPDISDSVWTYFVKPENKSKFIEDANYKVSVELKTKSDATTVVGIAAARADYFFTVNSDWTPCEFETGYVKGSTDHDFTIGLGLSSEIEIRNLKIEKLETTYTTEPSLVFDISKYAIETYLGKTDKATEIIDVSKLEGNAGYTITINTPMCHSTGISTGTDDSYIQDVKLHLRSYATENTGANNVSFDITNIGSTDFETSVMADTANEKSTAWNNNASPISASSNSRSFSVDFPNYKANDELTVDLITTSTSTSTSQNNSTSFTLSNFKVGIAEDPLFSDKIFAIQIDNDWIKSENGAPFSIEHTIKAGASINFDVGFFNGFNNVDWTPSDFDDVTRFLYTGNTNITDNITYAEENDDSGNPKFKITNNSTEEKIVKISLNENYEVVIEEVTGATITSWDNLKSQIEGLTNSNPTAEFVIADNLEATSTITVSKPVKITSDKNVTITRGSGFPDEFFDIDTGNLELAGTLEKTITLDGGNANDSPILATAPLITSSGNLTLTNCTLQNNTLNSTVPDFGNGGAVYVSDGTFNMNGGTISNCNANDGGAVYVSGGNFNMNGGTISHCNANDDGGGVWMNGGSSIWVNGGSSFTMSGDSKIDNCNSNSEGGGVYVTDSSNLCTFKMLDNATITSCTAGNGGGVSYGCGLKGTFEILGNAEISNNIAYDNDGNGGNVGGGIYLYGKLTMEGGTISGNEAPSGAGVYVRDGSSSFTMNGGKISDNNATVSGAGVYLSDSTSSFTMVGGEIKNNKATQSSYSGGIYVLGNIDITGGSICDNYAMETNYGASIYNQKSDNITVLDQTIYAYSHFTKNIIDGKVEDVTTGGGGNATQSISTFSDLRSAITDANTNSSFYALENPCVIYIGNSFSTDDTASPLTISTHVKLVANNTDGCTITKTSGYAETNIFTVLSGASLTLGDETATGILTIDGDGVQSIKSLINVSGTLVLNKNSVLQNSYIKNSTHGGAVYSNAGTIKIHGGVVQNNTINVSTKYGGGIYLINGTFEMTSGTFQGNSGSVTSSKMYGGALYFDSCTVNITGGTFINNSVLGSTDCYGGAIYISNSGNTSTPAKISYCTFNSNSAYQRGGAIYIGGSTTCIKINNCTFNDNSVTNSSVEGGAIYVANTSGGPVTISECNFENNTASSSENTIYNGSSSVSVIVDGTTVESPSVWNPSNSGGGLTNYTDTNGIYLNTNLISYSNLVEVITTEISVQSTEDKGAFASNKGTQVIQPYAIGQYEVSQSLFNEVMGSNPSKSIGENKPVESVSWYESIVFCNELSKLTIGMDDCVYYSDENFSAVYTLDDASRNLEPYMDQSKKGYRLPTEAEWEFAARGGNPSNTTVWNYIYSGSNNVSSVANYDISSDGLGQTSIVGSLHANTLNIYDMSGNVREWCFELDSNNLAITKGGSWYDCDYGDDDIYPFMCKVKNSEGVSKNYNNNGDVGFRICRSL